MEQAWINRANTIRRVLRADSGDLDGDQQAAITRVVARVDGHCLDTDEAADPIEYSDGAVEMQLGLVPGITPGFKTVRLVVYDAETPEGKAWGEFRVRVHAWEGCE